MDEEIPESLYNSINRNIMECKVICMRILLNRIVRINRNIMECKVTRMPFWRIFQFVLIETLWNVKSVEYGNNVK